MGHAVGKDIYRKLGKKVDGLAMRAPANQSLYRILTALYSAEEAELVVRMPYTLATLARIRRVTRLPEARLLTLLEGLCSKGLVIDFFVEGRYWYMPSPMLVGIFEMTMMRTGSQADSRAWAGLFHDYLGRDDAFLAANFGDGQQVSFMRTLVHEEAVDPEFVEILSYESAVAIVEQADKLAVGLCSCRHEASHLGAKPCATPLDTCSSFGMVADYLIRRNLAREVSRSEMLENVARSKDLRLVLTADNIKDSPTFICHCCKCCCGVLTGITRQGYVNNIVTSSYISRIDGSRCSGCGLCVDACPVNAIEKVADGKGGRGGVRVNPDLCIGCGVCALTCRKQAVSLPKRDKRVLHPSTTFERVILQSLERGTLQNQLFDDPARLSHKAVRGILGGFFKLPPVKRALMSETLRSRFLSSMKAGARLQGREILTRM